MDTIYFRRGVIIEYMTIFEDALDFIIVMHFMTEKSKRRDFLNVVLKDQKFNLSFKCSTVYFILTKHQEFNLPNKYIERVEKIVTFRNDVAHLRHKTSEHTDIEIQSDNLFLDKYKRRENKIRKDRVSVSKENIQKQIDEIKELTNVLFDFIDYITKKPST